MPSLTHSDPNLVFAGPLVEVVFLPSKAAIAAIIAGGGVPPNPVRAVAMIDTGATSTVITPRIVQALGLNVVGQIQMLTPSTTQPIACNQYSVDIVFAQNAVVVADVVVSEAGLIGQQIECLVGRDVLKHGVLIYTGYINQFTLSF